MNVQIVTTWQQGSANIALAFQQDPESEILTEYNGSVPIGDYNSLPTQDAKDNALLNACLIEYNNQNGESLTIEDLVFN